MGSGSGSGLSCASWWRRARRPLGRLSPLLRDRPVVPLSSQGRALQLVLGWDQWLSPWGSG
jgi:hypothetical protein